MSNDDVGSEDAQHLLFRFGFICFAAADAPRNDKTWVAIPRSWPKIQLGEFIIYRHPETRLSHQSQGDKHTVLIGDTFIVGDGDPLALAAGAVGDELLDLLDRLSGRFVLLIMQGGAGKVFHDAFGTRSIFYTINGAVALASHSHLLACAFGAKRILDSPLATLPIMLPGDMTMFHGVYALPPNHCYDIAARKVVRYWPRKSRRKTSFDEFFCVLDNYFKALIEFVQPPRRPILSLTGGIDSRTIASAFHHYGAEFSTVTFTNFHFEPWEAAPVAEMSRYLGVPHSEINESNDSVNAAARIGVRNSGRNKRPAVVAGMYRIYGSSPGAIFVTGLAAGVIRGFYNLKLNPMRDLSAKEMFRVSLEGGKSDKIPALDPDVESIILSSFEDFRERAGYDRFDGHGVDVNDIFYWEHKVGMGASAGLNEIDAAVPSIIGFNSRTVCEAAYGLSDDERLSKELFVEVIKRYDAHIAAVPFWPTVSGNATKSL